MISTLEPDLVTRFVSQSSTVIDGVIKKGHQPVIISSQKVRRLVRELLERSFPTIGVLSYSEIPASCTLDQVGIIGVGA